MDKNSNTETSINTKNITDDIKDNNAAGTSEAHEDDSATNREEAEGSEEAAYREECNQILNGRGFPKYPYEENDREGILNFFVNYRTPGVGHSGFKLDSYLGSGSFGYTFSVKSKNANYLIKLYKNKDPYGNVIDALENRNSELEILKGINKAIQNKENISAVPHPDLLYGVGETEPPYCLVTELEEGRFTLEDWNSRFNQSKHIKQNAQRSLDSLFKAFVKLSDAVSRLHNKGYIHNDIKYNNIIYSSLYDPEDALIINDRRVYLIDFGECVNTNDSGSARRAGMDYDDKRSYRPPSANVDGDSCVPSQALDIYCLCATMFWAITSEVVRKIPTADGGWKPDLTEIKKKLKDNGVSESFVNVLVDGLCWEKGRQIKDASVLSKRLKKAKWGKLYKALKIIAAIVIVIAIVAKIVPAFVGKTDTDISTANDADGSSISSSLPSSAVNILDTDWVDEGLHEMFKRYAELNGASVFDGKDIGVIKTIAINNNQLVVFSDDINSEKLNAIDIDTINFTLQSFKDFEKFPGLKRLIIANCCLPKNEQISLRRVEFHNCDFDSLAALSKSEEIVISNKDINGKNLNGFLSELEPETVSTLILSGFNNLDITGLHDFKKLSCLSLKNIDLSGCTNELIDAIKGMDNLEELDLSGSIISDAGRLSELSTLKNLKTMTINGLKVSTGIKSINFSDLDFVNDLIFDDCTFLASIADEGVKTAFGNIKYVYDDDYDGDTVFYNIRKGGYTSVVVNGGNGEDDGQNGIFFAKKIKKENSDDFDLDDFFGDKELFKMGTFSWSYEDDSSQYKSIESLDDISFIFPDAEELKIRKCPINISEECALTKFKNLTSLHISEISSIDLKVLKNPNLNKIIDLSIVDVLSVLNHDALLEIGNIIDLTFADINIGNLSLPLNLKNLQILYGPNHEKDIADLDLAGLCKGTSVERLQLSNVIISDNNVFTDALLHMNGLNLLCIDRSGSDKHLLSSLEGFERLNKLSSFKTLMLVNLSNDISDYSPLEEFMEKTNEEHDADNKTESQTWRVKK